MNKDDEQIVITANTHLFLSSLFFITPYTLLRTIVHTCAVRSRIGSDPLSLILLAVGVVTVSELAVS